MKGANQTEFLFVEDCLLSHTISLYHCHIVWIFWSQDFLELNRQTLTLKLLCRDMIWIAFGWFRCWGPRLCLFRVGQLKSLAFQLPLNDWLSRISSSTSKDISPIAHHGLFFSSVTSKTLNKDWYWVPIPWNKTIFLHYSKKQRFYEWPEREILIFLLIPFNLIFKFP